MNMGISEKKGFQPLLVAVILCIGLVAGYFYRSAKTMNNPGISPSRNNVLLEALDYIRAEYVDTVSEKKLTEAAIIAMLDSLDPHSVFIPAADLKEYTEPLEGKFSGIGIQFNMQNDTVVVIRTILNGPSEKIGIRPGDRIVKINDTLVAGIKMSTHQIMRKLKGIKGTKVKVGIKRFSVDHLVDFIITRDEIPLNSIDVSFMAEHGTGVIKISEFSRRTYEEFMNAVDRLNRQGLKKMILDLRDNGGGYMNAAVDIADEFLPDGDLIVFTQGRANPRRDLYATRKGRLENIPLIVLMNEWSASASEILSGALQDNDRAMIIGRRSFGKGLVQQQVELSDGSAVRLTVARYFTPSGRCIQKPYSHGKENYFDELNQRYQNGEFFNPDSIIPLDTLSYTTKKGRKVYGGGGIMPDVFIPHDTSFVSPFYSKVVSMGLLYKFAFNYSDANRVILSQFNDPYSIEKFLTGKKIFNQFLEYCSQQKVLASSSDLKKSGNYLRVQLFANIARYILDNEGYYPLLLQIDYGMKKAIEYHMINK